MMQKIFKLAPTTALFVLIASISGCAKDKSREHEAAHKEPIVGDLTPVVASFSSGTLSHCDKTNLPMMTEIAQALDQQKSVIEGYAAAQVQNNTSDKYRYVRVGPLTVRENLETLTPPSGWKFVNSSWKEIIGEYQAVLLNPTPKNWSALNKYVRGVLVDDKWRISYEDNYAIGHEDEPLIQELIDASRKCMADFNCNEPTYSPAGLKWLLKQNNYATLLAEIKLPKNPRGSIAYIEGLLNTDIKRFEMRKNGTITRNGSTLNLPLNAGVFAGVTETLTKYIESVWTGAELSLHIDWKTPSNPEFFSLLFDPASGERPYVVFSKKEVVLFNEIKAKSIPHEIGHVLGFRDHYFTVWNDDTCEYQDQYREDDIMSDSSLGIVTAEEWQTLLKTYP